MKERITRRAMLTALPAAASAAYSGEFVRFFDPLTETAVVRLTDPRTTSLLPAPTNRFVSHNRHFLVFSSDRTGKAAPFRMDLRTGALVQVAETAHLEPHSLSLDERERFLWLLDGESLKEVLLTGRRERTLADGVSAFSSAEAAGCVVVRRGRLEELSGTQKPLAEAVSSWCLVRPGGTGVAFGRETSETEREFCYIQRGAGEHKPVTLAKGRISNPVWRPDGRALLFLREVPGTGTYLEEIHEAIPETGEEPRFNKTSQFAAFAPNTDGSVFVGASRSKAQPTVVLLLRTAQRELTLCEHRASRPALVSPVFSPDSRRVYFQTDREGKSALYSVNVERLVEPTAF